MQRISRSDLTNTSMDAFLLETRAMISCNRTSHDELIKNLRPYKKCTEFNNPGIYVLIGQYENEDDDDNNNNHNDHHDRYAMYPGCSKNLNNRLRFPCGIDPSGPRETYKNNEISICSSNNRQTQLESVFTAS
jgi:hypothetical protein